MTVRWNNQTGDYEEVEDREFFIPMLESNSTPEVPDHV